jgi:hypothetical protein
MPRKKSGKKAVQRFRSSLDRIEEFAEEIDSSGLGAQAVTWAYEAALLKTYVAFENLMLDCIVAAINNDTSTISARTSVAFPKHLTDEVCEYLVIGSGYFDFRGRAGLIKVIKGYVPDGHWLLAAVKQPRHIKPLDQMIALRNYAAHESPVSKRKARDAIGQQRIASAGSWLKLQDRFPDMIKALNKVADDIAAQAPY